MEGYLEKLTIRSFTADDIISGGSPFNEYVAMLNPESYSVENQINYDISQPHGSSGSDLRFQGVAPRTFQFEFLVDGTGALGEKRDVPDDIEHFKEVTGFLGDIHRPTFLNIAWGTYSVNCVLTSATFKYDLFNAGGAPIRATINASFQEHTPMELQNLINNFSSPDLTHVRAVKEGDKLALMSFRIYDDSKHYIEVARKNDLDTIMYIEPGTRIAFPPFEKSEE